MDLNFDDTRSLKVLVVPVGPNSQLPRQLALLSRIQEIPLYDLNRPASSNWDPANVFRFNTQTRWREGALALQFMTAADPMFHSRLGHDPLKSVALVLGLVCYPELMRAGKTEVNRHLQTFVRDHLGVTSPCTARVLVFDYTFAEDVSAPGHGSGATSPLLALPAPAPPDSLVVMPPSLSTSLPSSPTLYTKAPQLSLTDKTVRDRDSDRLDAHLQLVLSVAAVRVLERMAARIRHLAGSGGNDTRDQVTSTPHSQAINITSQGMAVTGSSNSSHMAGQCAAELFLQACAPLEALEHYAVEVESARRLLSMCSAVGGGGTSVRDNSRAFADEVSTLQQSRQRLASRLEGLAMAAALVLQLGLLRLERGRIAREYTRPLEHVVTRCAFTSSAPQSTSTSSASGTYGDSLTQSAGVVGTVTDDGTSGEPTVSPGKGSSASGAGVAAEKTVSLLVHCALREALALHAVDGRAASEARCALKMAAAVASQCVTVVKEQVNAQAQIEEAEGGLGGLGGVGYEDATQTVPVTEGLAALGADPASTLQVWECLLRAAGVPGLTPAQQVNCLVLGSRLCAQLGLRRKSGLLLYLAGLAATDPAQRAAELAHSLFKAASMQYSVSSHSSAYKRSRGINKGVSSSSESTCAWVSLRKSLLASRAYTARQAENHETAAREACELLLLLGSVERWTSRNLGPHLTRLLQLSLDEDGYGEPYGEGYADIATVTDGGTAGTITGTARSDVTLSTGPPRPGLGLSNRQNANGPSDAFAEHPVSFNLNLNRSALSLLESPPPKSTLSRPNTQAVVSTQVLGSSLCPPQLAISPRTPAQYSLTPVKGSAFGINRSPLSTHFTKLSAQATKLTNNLPNLPLPHKSLETIKRSHRAAAALRTKLEDHIAKAAKSRLSTSSILDPLLLEPSAGSGEITATDSSKSQAILENERDENESSPIVLTSVERDPAALATSLQALLEVYSQPLEVQAEAVNLLRETTAKLPLGTLLQLPILDFSISAESIISPDLRLNPAQSNAVRNAIIASTNLSRDASSDQLSGGQAAGTSAVPAAPTALFYDPFAAKIRRGKDKADNSVVWSIGQPCVVVFTASNPLSVPLHFTGVQPIFEESPNTEYQCECISQPIILPAACLNMSVRLTVQPKVVGRLKLCGIRITLQGGVRVLKVGSDGRYRDDALPKEWRDVNVKVSTGTRTQFRPMSLDVWVIHHFPLYSAGLFSSNQIFVKAGEHPILVQLQQGVEKHVKLQWMASATSLCNMSTKRSASSLDWRLSVRNLSKVSTNENQTPSAIILRRFESAELEPLMKSTGSSSIASSSSPHASCRLLSFTKSQDGQIVSCEIALCHTPGLHKLEFALDTVFLEDIMISTPSREVHDAEVDIQLPLYLRRQQNLILVIPNADSQHTVKLLHSARVVTLEEESIEREDGYQCCLICGVARQKRCDCMMTGRTTGVKVTFVQAQIKSHATLHVPVDSNSITKLEDANRLLTYLKDDLRKLGVSFSADESEPGLASLVSAAKEVCLREQLVVQLGRLTGAISGITNKVSIRREETVRINLILESASVTINNESIEEPRDSVSNLFRVRVTILDVYGRQTQHAVVNGRLSLDVSLPMSCGGLVEHSFQVRFLAPGPYVFMVAVGLRCQPTLSSHDPSLVVDGFSVPVSGPTGYWVWREVATSHSVHATMGSSDDA